jgi:hypothetical protein
MEHLDADCILFIIACLGEVSDVIAFAGSCKRLRSLLRLEKAGMQVVRRCTFRHAHPDTNQRMEAFMRRWGHCIARYNGRKIITNEKLRMLAAAAPALASVNLSRCELVTDEA